MTKEDLLKLQALSLEEKIQVSTARIIEWYNAWGGQVYVSFSGGKDSTVLLHLVRNIFSNVTGAYCDTGLEYPELREFVKTFENIIWLKPKLNFIQVLTKYGYPVISKEQSAFVNEYRTTNSEKLKNIRINGNKYGMGKISKKWLYLIDADFMPSDKCCDYQKKQPFKKFEKESGLKPILGIQTEESAQRKSNWLKYGCNAFNEKRPKSAPLSFWTEQDILAYIKKYNLSVASVYGELIEVDGKLKFTGCQRTGCMYCGFGCHLEKEPNRFQRLVQTHPQIYDYCMRGGKYEDGKWVPEKGLGMAKVLETIGVKWYTNEEVKEKYLSYSNKNSSEFKENS